MARSIELDDAEPFIHRTWTFQRVGWALMLVVIGAAFLGGLGRGPVAHAREETSTGMTVEWDRITRHQSPTELRLLIPQDAVDDGVARIAISSGLLLTMDIEGVTPEPEAQLIRGDDVVYAFAVARPPGRVRISMKPDEMGLRRGTVGIVDGERVDVTLFVLP